jgi:hypothetical protein
MTKIIAQKDEVCTKCGYEIPKGSLLYLDSYEEVNCEDCMGTELDGHWNKMD